MPEFLSTIRVAWTWPTLNADEQRIVRRCEAVIRSDPTTLTIESVTELLAKWSRALPGRRIAAYAEDESENSWVLVAHDGVVDDAAPDDALGNEAESSEAEQLFPVSLDVEDFLAAGVEKVLTSLFWPAAMLAELKHEANRLDQSLSWAVQRAWRLAGESASTDDHFVESLPDKYKPPAESGRTDKRKQSVYVPPVMWGQMKAVAARGDRSMSYVVQRVWARAYPRIAAIAKGEA